MNNAILTLLFWCMIGLSVISIGYPWRFRTPASRICLHAPIGILVLFVAYECLMPVEMNIRIDLLVLLPIFGVVFVIYCGKLALVSRRTG